MGKLQNPQTGLFFKVLFIPGKWTKSRLDSLLMVVNTMRLATPAFGDFSSLVLDGPSPASGAW